MGIKDRTHAQRNDSTLLHDALLTVVRPSCATYTFESSSMTGIRGKQKQFPSVPTFARRSTSSSTDLSSTGFLRFKLCEPPAKDTRRRTRGHPRRLPRSLLFFQEQTGEAPEADEIIEHQLRVFAVAANTVTAFSAVRRSRLIVLALATQSDSPIRKTADNLRAVVFLW